MKKILVVTPYFLFPGEGAYRRFRYICELLSKSNFEVHLVTSQFLHLTKKQRDTSSSSYKKLGYKVNFISEPGYKKNIDFRRLISQKRYAENLKVFLNDYEKMDLIYCAIPTPEGALVAGEYAANNKIPFILDVQDLWPESMKMALDIPLLSNFLFLPMKKRTEKAYSLANSIVAVSDTYLKRAKKSNNIATNELVVFIGTDIEKFDQEAIVNFNSVQKNEEEIWITYIGMLGHSYDLITVMKAIQKVGNDKIKLLVIGDGPRKNEFENFAATNNINSFFTGYVDYGLMAAYLLKSDISINALKKKSEGSVINKIGDYLSAGLPILNGSSNEELNTLLSSTNSGLNFIPESVEDLAEKMNQLVMDINLRKIMGEKSRELALTKFNRNQEYKKIIQLVNKNLIE